MPEIDFDKVPEYYRGYVARVKSEPVLEALNEELDAFINIFKNMPAEKHDYAYAEGKWTPKQLLQHICDAERIFAQRALRFARHDMTQLPGFDQNIYVDKAHVDHRTMDDLIEEFQSIRSATVTLYKGLRDSELSREGFANGVVLSVRNLCYVLVGHALHHFDVIQERYL
jgi:uncharacterized damage-inducible protein DinB